MSPTPIKPSSFHSLIGVAREEITPPLGIYSRNWGAAKKSVADGIHRPLTLTCLTLQSGKNKKPLVLIAADLGWWKNSNDEHFVRDEILKALSLDPSRLMICLSHTHAGPSLSRGDADNPGGELIEPYLRHLREVAIHAVRRALTGAIPCVLTWRYGKCDLATNRDLPEPTKKRFLVGHNPESPADDTVLVGRVTDAKRHVVATLVNYACHLTTLAWENRLLSPDYVGAMRETVETTTSAPCLFLQGASGELSPAEQYSGDVAVADAHGRRLGHAVLATLEAMLPPEIQLKFTKAVESGAPLALWERSRAKASSALTAQQIEVKVPLKSLPSLAEIEDQIAACTDPILRERLYRQRGVRQSVGEGKTALLPVWVWRLGDALLVGQPTETYSQFQQILRREFRTNAVAVMNLVNGHIGYLPPKNLYGKNLYPVWQTPFAKGSLERLTTSSLRAAKACLTK